jgi:hypothetical protein
VHLSNECPIAKNSLEGLVFLQTWEQERQKDLVGLSLARDSKHLLNVDDAGSVIIGIGKVLSWKVKYISSNATQFLNLVRMSISDALIDL